MVKNQLAVQDAWVESLGREDPLKKGMATHSMESSRDSDAWRAIVHGVTKSQTQLSNTYTLLSDKHGI